MVLTRSHELQKIKINVDAGAVEVNQVKYLGVLIDNQLKWQQQLDHVCKKLACALYALLNFFDNLFKYLKTSHSYNTRIRSNQNFFKPSVNTNIRKKSIQYRGQ